MQGLSIVEDKTIEEMWSINIFENVTIKYYLQL